MWLMAPANRQERVRRRLRYEWASIKNVESYIETGRLPENGGIERRKNRVLGLASAAGITEREPRKKPQFSEIVSDVGVAVDLVDDERNLPLLFWKLCSAIAHGNTWGTSEIIVVAAFSPDHSSGTGAVMLNAPTPGSSSPSRSRSNVVSTPCRSWSTAEQQSCVD
jgi:hypothetical protein